MCRIFAFRSRVDLKVQRSLVKAENALHIQSRKHPHGWGIAYYLTAQRDPHVIKSMESAFTDERFRRVSSFLTSHAVIAHVRKATVGELSEQNTHPFSWNGWTFCHNGTIFGFDEIQDRMRERIHPRFLAEIEGTTDSETFFYLVLSELERAGFNVDTHEGPLPDTLWERLGELLGWVRDLSEATGVDEREAMMNFVLTNGMVMLAARFNGGLSFSTQKRRCADFDICPVPQKVCFGARQPGVQHTHLLLASDPTSSDDVWEEIPNRGLLLVEQDLSLRVRPLGGVKGGPAWFA
jgi:glutamine amidotransferase